MELPDLVLKDPKKSADIKRILSGLILDEATLERVREVFRREIKLGLQFGVLSRVSRAQATLTKQ